MKGFIEVFCAELINYSAPTTKIINNCFKSANNYRLHREVQENYEEIKAKIKEAQGEKK